MTPVQLHVLSAICAVARAVNVYRRNDEGGWSYVEAECGPWSGSYDSAGFEEHFVGFYVDAPGPDHGQIAILATRGIVAMTYGRVENGTILFQAPQSVETRDVDRSLVTAGITPPDGFDWQTYEPEAVAA